MPSGMFSLVFRGAKALKTFLVASSALHPRGPSARLPAAVYCSLEPKNAILAQDPKKIECLLHDRHSAWSPLARMFFEKLEFSF